MAAAALKFLVPLAAGAAALFAFGKPANASAKPAGGAGVVPPKPASSPGQPTAGEPQPTAATIAGIQAALLTADPAKMREMANDLDNQGFKSQAASLRAAADAVELAMKNAPKVTQATPGIPSIPGVATPAAGAPAPLPMTPQVDPARALAASVALEIAGSSKGRENKNLVAQYQKQEQSRGQAVGKIDGLYGPKTALTLATDFGIVPPKPLYWPVNPTPSKNSYRATLNAIAKADPQRAEEWQRAAVV